MAAPRGNQNRRGRTGQAYNLSIPRLQCNSCSAARACPLFKPDAPCAFLKRIRSKVKLETLDDLRAMRVAFLQDTLIQLEVMAMTGIEAKDQIAMRKLCLQHLAELERDEFFQQTKTTEKKEGTFVSKLIENARQKREENRFQNLEVRDGEET